MRRVLPALLAVATLASMGAAQAKSDNNPAAVMASFAAGTVFGLPISIVRHQWIDIKGLSKDFIGDSDSALVKGVGYPLCFVSGMINGTFAGIGFCPINAWKGSQEAPFSAKAFSLSEDIEK